MVGPIRLKYFAFYTHNLLFVYISSSAEYNYGMLGSHLSVYIQRVGRKVRVEVLGVYRKVGTSLRSALGKERDTSQKWTRQWRQASGEYRKVGRGPAFINEKEKIVIWHILRHLFCFYDKTNHTTSSKLFPISNTTVI